MSDKKEQSPTVKKEKKAKKKFDSPIPQNTLELDMFGVKPEQVCRVKTARVFQADYDLIQAHFPDVSSENLKKVYPELNDLPASLQANRIKEKIDDWLLYYTAFMSKQQTTQERVNTPIQITKEEVRAWRPPKYGRALVFSMTKIRAQADYVHPIPLAKETLLDVKGCGIAPGVEPTFATHSDGLLKLSDALLEYSNQKAINGIFKHSKSQFKTLPLYAIIDLGFNIKHKYGIRSRAALMIRQAHRRPHNPGGLPTYNSDEQHVQLEVELLLRRYGITSVNNITTLMVYEDKGKLKLEYGGHPVKFANEGQEKNIREVSRYKPEDGRKYFDGVNVQLTRDTSRNPSRATLVDFGTYRVRSRFENTVLSLVSDRLMRWGGSIFPHFQNYPQPDKNISVPAEVWGDEGEFRGYKTRLRDSRQDTFCEGLELDYREGRLTKEEVMGRLEAFIQTATSKWE